MRNECEKRINRMWKVCVLLFVSVLSVLGLPLLTMVTKAAPADLTISSARELNEFAQKVNNGNNYEGKVVKLANDIVFDGVTVNNFTPIGNPIGYGFSGTFDGGGYAISGIDVTDADCAALFARVDGGIIKNLSVKNCSFTGKGLAAGIVACFYKGTVENCHVVDCEINQSDYYGSYAGGVVAYADDATVIMNCSNNSNVQNAENMLNGRDGDTGGIVGETEGFVLNSCNTGNVTGKDDGTGGVCGESYGTVQNCFNAGRVSGTGYVGGIVGAVKKIGGVASIIANCYTSESACATNFGSMNGTEKNCKAYTNSYMQSAEFLNQLIANRGSNTDWFLWEKRAESIYPLPVKVTNLNNCSVAIVADACVYNGKGQTPAVSIKKGSYSLIKDVDYTVTYQNNINAGTATAVISGTGMYTGDVTKSFTIQKANTTIVYKSSITKTYGAKAFSLGAKLKTGAGKLSYKSSDKKVAKVNSKGKVTIKGVGKAEITVTCPASSNYKAATVVTSVTVKPKKQSISVTRNGSKMKISWKKDSKVSGYEVQYATNKSFKKNCKTITIKKKNKTSYTVKKLKKGKKYYVRVRSYKNVTFNGQKVKVTSAWSKVKKVSGY